MTRFLHHVIYQKPIALTHTAFLVRIGMPPKARKTTVDAPRRPDDPLADAFRRWGYLAADLDPLGRLVPYEHPDVRDAVALAAQTDVERWRTIYTRCLGIEYMHMIERERVEWVREVVEHGMPEIDERWVLGRLMETELFERFLHARYVGSKRFSIEGVAGLIPLQIGRASCRERV